MAEALRPQGFSQQDWGGVAGQEHEAFRKEDDFACLIGAHVYWRADALGRITAIRGSYNEEGCL